MKINKVNLQDKFEQFNDQWSPKIIGQLNGQMVKIAKVEGEFPMHKHDNEDELFFVVEGQLHIILEEEKIILNPGEFVIIPKGVPHQPFAPHETKIMLFEPSTTLNTGNIQHEMTVEKLDKL